MLNIKPSSLSLSIDENEVYAFDLLGRLLTAWIADQTFVRTLENRVIKKWWDPFRRRCWKNIEELGPEPKRQFLEKTSARVTEVCTLLLANQVKWADSSAYGQEQVAKWLGRVAGWDYERLENERQKFYSVYTPVRILPPDQYFSLVLQITEGCRWNRCTFCDFYRDSQFRIKSDEEFQRHIASVKEFFGEAIRLRRSVFLGAANALFLPQERLLNVFDQINQQFWIVSSESQGVSGEHLFHGIFSFIDGFTGTSKLAIDFHELKSRNLIRVYLGVETGCDELLRFVNKPVSAQQMLELAHRIKAAGIQLGVILLVGLGGNRYFQKHIDATVQLVTAMGLKRGDLLYLSPLVEQPDSQYANRCIEARIRPLTDEETANQLQVIGSRLAIETDDRPLVATYDVREFVY